MREQLERRVALIFVGYLLAMATVSGAIIVSGWFAGVLYDPAERVFWVGAVVSGLTVGVFAFAAFPGWSDEQREIRRLRGALRVDLVMAALGPALCIAGLIADFYS